VLIVAPYVQTLRADFLRWDDLDHVLENPRVIARDGLLRSWYETKSPGFYPITYTTFYVEWRAARGAPWLFHLDNALLHAGNAILVGQLCLQLGLAPIPSGFAAALWALHPMQVASVAWITERKNVLYVFLYLAALHLYVSARRGASGARLRPSTAYSLSLALFGFAMLSKAAAMTLPAAIVLVEWARRRPLDRRFWISLTPYVALAAVATLALLSSVPTNIRTPPFASRLALAPRTLAFYVATFFWPSGLLPMYPRWPLEAAGLRAHLPWLLLGAAGAVVVVFRDRLPRASLFGLAFFLLNGALVAGLVWFTYLSHTFVGDHLAYLPSVGLAMAAVGALATLATRAHLPAWVLTAALTLWCGALGVATWRQIPVWHDTETLWTYTIARNPDCALCHYNLGVLLEDRGDLDAAAAHYETALRIQPDAETAINLGNVRLTRGRPEEAVALYRQAVQLDSSNEKAPYNLAVVLAGQGKIDEAIARYRQALALNPAMAEAHRDLGEALLHAGRVAEAKAELEQALRLAPGDPEAEHQLGRAAGAAGEWDQAVAHYSRALRGKYQGRKSALIHRELAEVLHQLGRDGEAIIHDQAAYRLDPDDTDAVIDLATALVGAGRIGEAVEILKSAVGRHPDAAQLAGSLAWIRATRPEESWRDASEAVRLAEHACALTGFEDADQLDTLAAAYAEAGRFEDAVRIGRRALELAAADGEQAEEMRRRLALYEQRRPFRSP
jgi:tetratricopeptide (TPR) repeat protein